MPRVAAPAGAGVGLGDGEGLATGDGEGDGDGGGAPVNSGKMSPTFESAECCSKPTL